MTLMQWAAAVALSAVREMQQEFIQSQAATTQQRLAVQPRALSQKEESLRVQQSLIAQLASLADADTLRKLREQNPQFPAFTGRTDRLLPLLFGCQTGRMAAALRRGHGHTRVSGLPPYKKCAAPTFSLLYGNF